MHQAQETTLLLVACFQRNAFVQPCHILTVNLHYSEIHVEIFVFPHILVFFMSLHLESLFYGHVTSTGFCPNTVTQKKGRIHLSDYILFVHPLFCKFHVFFFGKSFRNVIFINKRTKNKIGSIILY